MSMCVHVRVFLSVVLAPTEFDHMCTWRWFYLCLLLPIFAYFMVYKTPTI